MTVEILPAGTLLKCGSILSSTSEIEFIKFKRWHSDFTGTLHYYHENNLVRYVNEETDELVFCSETYPTCIGYMYTLFVLDTELVRMQSSNLLRFYKVLIVDDQIIRWIPERTFDISPDLRKRLP
jgi:hypothetical protein